MNNYKIATTVALFAISTVAYAGAVYLECEDHPDMIERYKKMIRDGSANDVSYGDCAEARHRHNRDYHEGVAVAICRNRLR